MNLEDSIKLAEGFRVRPYDDATGEEILPGDTIKGNVTIGWGTNLSDGISIKAAQYLFTERMEVAEKDASVVFGYGNFYKLPRIKQEALIEMAYQLGRPRLAGFKKMVVAVKSKDWETAKKEALDSSWARNFPERASRVVAKFTTSAE